MPVRRSPFEQLSDHRSAVPLPPMSAVDDQSADPEALVSRIDASHHEADDLLSGPNGERTPWAVPAGAQSQVVGHRPELDGPGPTAGLAACDRSQAGQSPRFR